MRASPPLSRVAPLALAVALLVGVPAASGYERTLAESGEPLAWPGSCYQYSINEDGSDDVAFADLQQLTVECHETWAEVSCSYFYFVETAPAATDRVEFNEQQGNVNLLVWRERTEEWPAGVGVVALTTVNYDAVTGEIFDVDIEFNGATFEFGTLDSYPGDTGLIDLRSTMTHEIGHTLGLDHSDDPATTMWPQTEAGATGKRDLEQDDEDGLCAIYPLADDPQVCREPHCGLDLDGTSDGCDDAPAANEEDCDCRAVGVGGGARPASWWASSLLLAVLAWSRRRRG